MAFLEIFKKQPKVNQKKKFLTFGNRNGFELYCNSKLEKMLRRGNTMYITKTYEKDEVRRGDWICLICNNHNFSFRKICNRCQSQSRRDNEVQTSILRKRIDMQINLELEASYNTFPRALFLTLKQENSRLDSRTDPRTPIKVPSMTLIEDAEANGENDCNQWVTTVLEEEICSPQEVNEENIFFCGRASSESEKASARPLELLASAVIY